MSLADYIDDCETGLREALPKRKKKKHIIKEGSRHHVLYWDTNGKHCSEPDCEVNQRKEREG